MYNDPRLSKLDQRRLIEDRDALRNNYAALSQKHDELQQAYNSLQQRYFALVGQDDTVPMPVIPNLDEMVF